ncbi:MAG: replicative DNA helicase [Isosphaeraceae bacterium]|jgi:replicative DNA helicase|nr:MAG: replicative DNA helicase [Isosphaeraceae bacterium]
MSHRTGADLYREWWDEVTTDAPPAGWSAGDPALDHVEVAPSRIILVAGPPGAGKTALINQWVGGLLSGNLDVRVALANVEMPPAALLSRHLSRLSGVPLADIRKRQVAAADRAKLDEAAARMRGWLDRLAFADAPHRLDAIARAGADFGADLVVIDYVQRVAPADKASGLRERMNVLMTELRRLADRGGVAVIAAAAVSRSRDNAGRASYAGRHLSLASLRESGELEFGADDVLLLAPADDADDRAAVRSMLLAHAKARYAEPKDVALSYDRRIQRFAPDEWIEAASPSPPSNGRPASKAHDDGERGRWKGDRR